MLTNIFLILLGLLLLTKGGDYLIDGASALARYAHMSPMVIGLTVVGFGTSCPELLVSTQAALAGSPGIAIGNVVGSNIANIALILGITALFCPLPVRKDTLLYEIPFTILAVAIFIQFANSDGRIEQWEGFVSVVLLAAFVIWQIKRSQDEPNREDPQPIMPLWRAILTTIISFAALVYGANCLVGGASGIAFQLGQSAGIAQATMERVVGLTIVAVGTSLPELFASVMAARKGQTDMAIGNIVGSVTFNLLCVVGVASCVCPIEGSNVGFLVDFSLMGILALLLWIFLRTSYRLSRSEGIVLSLIYASYLGYTVAEVFIL